MREKHKVLCHSKFLIHIFLDGRHDSSRIYLLQFVIYMLINSLSENNLEVDTFITKQEKKIRRKKETTPYKKTYII